MHTKKLILLLVLFIAVILFVYFDLHHFLTLTKLKASIVDFKIWREASPFMAIGLFSFLYIIITALSLPGSAFFTLTAGALFGLFEGIVIALFASSIGALIAFFISRYLLRGIIYNRFPEKLAVIDQGLKKECAFYLFSLRLVPVIPFFLVNILMGVTTIKPWTFYWVSFVGMSAVTSAYVNAGTQLSQIDSLANILSIELILSFTLLGFLPFIAQRILRHSKIKTQ